MKLIDVLYLAVIVITSLSRGCKIRQGKQIANRQKLTNILKQLQENNKPQIANAVEMNKQSFSEVEDFETVEEDQTDCEGDYERLGDHCYAIRFNSKATLDTSLATCKSENAALLSIETMEEFELIRKRLLRFMKDKKLPIQGNNFWTCGVAVGEHGYGVTWMWSETGKTVDIHDAWFMGMPTGRRSCAVFYGYIDYFLTDVSCHPDKVTENYGYICEQT